MKLSRKGPMRRVVRAREYRTPNHPKGTWSVAMRLECGHECHQKGSIRVPKRKHCPDCDGEDES